MQQQQLHLLNLLQYKKEAAMGRAYPFGLCMEKAAPPTRPRPGKPPHPWDPGCYHSLPVPDISGLKIDSNHDNAACYDPNPRDPGTSKVPMVEGQRASTRTFSSQEDRPPAKPQPPRDPGSKKNRIILEHHPRDAGMNRLYIKSLKLLPSWIISLTVR